MGRRLKGVWALSLLLVLSPAMAQKVLYVHTDALGSVVMVTDANREVVQPTSEYEPYGKLLNRSNDDQPGYTGHVMDAATGLVYMQARYYDPSLGRFLSVDPVTADANTGANFNRYWYANNNPYRFTDPDGRFGRDCLGGLCDRYREQGGRACEMTCVQAGGGRRGGTSGGRRGRNEVRSTTEARDQVQGVSLTNEIRRLDPNRSMPQFVGPANGPAYNRVTNEVLSRELVATRADVARRIANNGHSFQKHVLGEGQFSGVASTPQAFGSHINNVLNNYTNSGTGANGQAIFYHSPTSTIVIVNPNSVRFDGGTAFQAPIARFNDLVGGN